MTLTALYFSVGPTKVTILNGREPISAGKRYEVNCQTIGARPQPTVTWWMAGKQVRPDQLLAASPLQIACKVLVWIKFNCQHKRRHFYLLC